MNPEQFKARDASSYDSVASGFDYWTRRVSQHFADRVVSLTGCKPGDRVLDVGTGSGLAALAAARVVGPAGRVVGIDLSEGLMTQARGSAAAVQFCRMDAEALEFEPESFDAVISLFALLHFPDPLRALREMFRVVKPGGRAVVAIGRGPNAGFRWLRAAWNRIREIRDVASGRLLVAPAFLDQLVRRNLPREAAHEKASASPRIDSLERAMRLAGFHHLRSEWLSRTHSIATVREFWEVQATLSSVSRKRMECAAPDQLRAIEDMFAADCERVLARGGKLIYRNAALIVSGIRAS